MMRWTNSCVARPRTGAGTNDTEAGTEAVVVSWSGGKDSALALHATLADPTLHVAALLTTITEGYDRISMHGVRRSLLERLVDSLGLPLILARIPKQASNELYESAQRAALAPLRQQGIERVVCGDLYLQDIRHYRDRLFASVRMRGAYPLWSTDTPALALRFIDLGFRAVLVTVDPSQLDASFAGRDFDRDLLRDLPSSVDPCGEGGEFHTFVHDGPIFRTPVPVQRGEIVSRDGFVFQDLV